MENVVGLMRNLVFFNEFLVPHMDFESSIRAMDALGLPYLVSPALIEKGVEQSVNETVDDLNTRLTDTGSYTVINAYITECLIKFIARVTNPEFVYPADSFQVNLTVNHMRTRDLNNNPYSGTMLNPFLVVNIAGGQGMPARTERPIWSYVEGFPGKELTHLRGQLKYRLRYENGAMIRENVDTDQYALNFMIGELPHAPNAHGHPEILWVETSNGV